MERIICLSSRYPEPVPRWRDRSGPLRGSLFGLAPDGVFRAASLALRAVRSYRTFSPLPALKRNAGGLIFCGTVRRTPALARRGTARVYLNRTGLSYAASRPSVFGLSSPLFPAAGSLPAVAACETSKTDFQRAAGKSGAILRPSKTAGKIADEREYLKANSGSGRRLCGFGLTITTFNE